MPMMPWLIGAFVSLVLLGLTWVGWHILTAPEGWEDEDGFHAVNEEGDQYPGHVPLAVLIARHKVEWLDDEFMPRLSNEVAVTFDWTWPQAPEGSRSVQGVV